MTTVINKATEKQLAYINDLLNSRVAPADLRAITTDLLTRAEASTIIGVLLKQPRKIGSGRPATPPVAVQQPTPVASTPVAPKPYVYVDRNLIPNTVPTTQIPVGIYTVEHGDGKHTTLKFTADKYRDGHLVVALLVGPDNELSYKKFGSLSDKGVKKFSTAYVSEKTIAAIQFLLTGGVDTAREKFLELSEAHAFASGNCLACLKTLTVGKSVRRGLGPVCAKRLGVL